MNFSHRWKHLRYSNSQILRYLRTRTRSRGTEGAQASDVMMPVSAISSVELIKGGETIEWNGSLICILNVPKLKKTKTKSVSKSSHLFNGNGFPTATVKGSWSLHNSSPSVTRCNHHLIMKRCGGHTIFK